MPSYSRLLPCRGRSGIVPWDPGTAACGAELSRSRVHVLYNPKAGSQPGAGSLRGAGDSAAAYKYLKVCEMLGKNPRFYSINAR